MGVLSTGKLKAHRTDFPPNHEFADLKQNPTVLFREAICHGEMCPGF